ncbi:zinc-ribbon domain-containing protein [Candidatus Rariloculus sp.]|uniref:zinc-ribbon domain-containing protein n=1 Tax=Candidatus Rariloculus sp. TaxID=3101265 RepID=UPI003D107651
MCNNALHYRSRIFAGRVVEIRQRKGKQPFRASPRRVAQCERGARNRNHCLDLTIRPSVDTLPFRRTREILLAEVRIDMALVKCRECDAEVSKGAKTCPQCGTVWPARGKVEQGINDVANGLMKIGLGLVCIAIFILVFIALVT